MTSTSQQELSEIIENLRDNINLEKKKLTTAIILSRHKPSTTITPVATTQQNVVETVYTIIQNIENHVKDAKTKLKPSLKKQSSKSSSTLHKYDARRIIRKLDMPLTPYKKNEAKVLYVHHLKNSFRVNVLIRDSDNIIMKITLPTLTNTNIGDIVYINRNPSKDNYYGFYVKINDEDYYNIGIYLVNQYKNGFKDELTKKNIFKNLIDVDYDNALEIIDKLRNYTGS